MVHADLASKMDPGLDPLEHDEDPSYDATQSGAAHGTACAGLVAAETNNGVGIAGGCPECRIRCVRLLWDKPVPTSADVEAFQFALDTNASVVSNSWGFVDKFPVEGWCADQVRGWLQRCGLAEEESIPALGLAQVVGAFDCGHLPPAEVANLAEVIRVWPSNLGEHYRWRAETASLSLRSRAGTWVPAKALIRGHGPEDQLLSRFAPDKAVLHRDYVADSPAFRFVEQYLPVWSDDPSMLAGWCMSATGDDPQSAALKGWNALLAQQQALRRPQFTVSEPVPRRH